MKTVKSFFIGVIDKEESIGRRYSDIVLSLCQIAARELGTKDYRIMVVYAGARTAPARGLNRALPD